MLVSRPPMYTMVRELWLRFVQLCWHATHSTGVATLKHADTGMRCKATWGEPGARHFCGLAKPQGGELSARFGTSINDDDVISH
jgi:hypothetical protein